MRILGIDPGLNITGYGCVEFADGDRDATLVEGGVFRFQSKKPMPVRLRQLHEDLNEVLTALTPDRVVVEQLFSHYRHVRTSILMGHARGVVLMTAQMHGIELDELTPTEVKKAVTGHGHATKQQMQMAIMSQCQLDVLPEPPDLADAIAIALCAARRVQAEAITPQPSSD
ncbi:MAG: crossover junction endodeoxyribonuclease RuvC [Planctomycetota bacterium]